MNQSDHEAALRASTARYKETATAHEEAREASVADVVAALKDGVIPTRVAELSPFTATHVRKIARENGVPPARKGKPAS